MNTTLHYQINYLSGTHRLKVVNFSKIIGKKLNGILTPEDFCADKGRNFINDLPNNSDYNYYFN